MIGLSKSAAIDYGQQGSRVNVVSPGFTRSEMVDPYVESAPELRRASVSGTPLRTAEAITFLCSDAARFVNGAVLKVDGGDTSRVWLGFSRPLEPRRGGGRGQGLRVID